MGVNARDGVTAGVEVGTVAAGDGPSAAARSGHGSPGVRGVQPARHRSSRRLASARRPVRSHGALGGAENGAGTDMVAWPPGRRPMPNPDCTRQAPLMRWVRGGYAAGIDRGPERVQTGDRSRLGDHIPGRAVLPGPPQGEPDHDNYRHQPRPECLHRGRCYPWGPTPPTTGACGDRWTTWSPTASTTPPRSSSTTTSTATVDTKASTSPVGTPPWWPCTAAWS